MFHKMMCGKHHGALMEALEKDAPNVAKVMKMVKEECSCQDEESGCCGGDNKGMCCQDEPKNTEEHGCQCC